MNLTAWQSRVLRYMCDYASQHWAVPTRQEIAEFAGYNHDFTTRYILETLEKKGYIERRGKQISNTYRLTDQAMNWYESQQAKQIKVVWI